MSEKPLLPPATPNDLTKEFLTAVLRHEYCQHESMEVTSFAWKDADAGVLSHVVMMDVEYAKVDVLLPPTKFVAKFKLPEFPLEHMFLVESQFYREIAAQEDLPFSTPRPVFTSSSMVMVEFISTTEPTYTAVEGCPQENVISIITKLGQFHSNYLKLSVEELDEKYENLASPAGVGSALNGIGKETQFPGMWQEFLNNIPNLDEQVRFQVKDICRELCHCRLREIHDKIHDNKYQTIIHGDFHVANMIFTSGDNVWLVDWATCGRGCPLVDVAFFAIVSITTSVRKEMEKDMLQAYHQALDYPTLTMEECQKWYRLCVLNQFLILVAYDRMARDIAKKAKKPEELNHHFNVVNARACQALIDCYGEELLPPRKTKEEEALPPQGECSL